MPLDPQVKAYLAQLPVTAAGTLPVSELRATARARRLMQVLDAQMPGPAGDIPLRIYTPPGPAPKPVLVYFHGGGWVTGDLDVVDSLCRNLSEWAGCVVVSVNYRHAPEHVFPAALDDAFAATQWVVDYAEDLGADAARVGVGGASAGGNLAAAVAIRARDEGGPGLVFQYLVYPVTDASLDTPSMHENASGYGLSRETMAWYWDQYVPNREERRNPLAAPLAATDLSRLPAAFVITAEYDPLRDEGELYARRMQDAGVSVHLKRYDGMIHGFLSQTPEFDAARQCLIDSVRELKQAFAAVPGS